MDWLVTIVGVIGFYLAGQKVWWAWYVNIANQILWLIFAVVTEQWGFLIGIPLYMSVFVKNAYDWTKEHRQKQRIVAGLRNPIGKLTLLENDAEGMRAEGVLFKPTEDFDIDYNTVAMRIEGGVYHTYTPECPEGCYGQMDECIYKKE